MDEKEKLEKHQIARRAFLGCLGGAAVAGGADYRIDKHENDRQKFFSHVEQWSVASGHWPVTPNLKRAEILPAAGP